ncbi:MAG: hypothetical protein IT330_01745 [Anaerolineae bacterium]|nr:hypothetical protein [Anaerolineae bacterium]
MNILDENILESQRERLAAQGVPFRQIGYEIGRKGMDDEEIIPFLLQLSRATFFTHDLGVYKRQLCHVRYCLVYLSVGKYEAAEFIRRVLRHSEFNISVKRMGTVLRVSRSGISIWRLHASEAEQVGWP